jgi:ribonuclease E
MDVSEEIQEVTEIDSLHVELPVSPPSPPEPPTKSPAVSLWHKIFGSPAEQTAKMPEPAANEPAWNDDARGEAPRPAFDETFASPADEELAAGEFDDMSSRGERKSFADDDASDEERKRGRSRRRRRGGRGRKSGELQGERSPVPLQQESEGIDDLGVELDDADDDDDADQSASFADGAERPGSDLDIDDADGDSGELGGRGRSAAQRAIPSWDEAIGSIVDSNMQSRSQRRPPPRSGNGPRGRSRGRRRN